MAAVELQRGLRENTVGMLEQFADVAATDPVAALLVVLGGLLVAFSSGVFGVLTLGAVGASIKRLLPSAGGPPRESR